MNWMDSISALAIAAGKSVIRSGSGIGIEFSDGNDVFWLLPDEVMSTVPVPATADVDACALWQEFCRIDDLRQRAVHVIAHYLASLRIQFDRRRSGRWPIQTESGVSSSLTLGAYLTRLARDGKNVYDLVQSRFQKYGIIRHPPTPKRMDRYLACSGPPVDEQRIQPTPSIAIIHTVEQALAMIGVCGVLTGDREINSGEALLAAAKPTGPIAQALRRVGERLPGVKASVELLNGALSLDFDDGHDCFEISPKSRELVRKIRRLGWQRAGDALADEYLALNAARSAVFRALALTCDEMGWASDQYRMPLLGLGPTWYLGKKFREISFSPGQPLTDALRSISPAEVFEKQFASRPDFARACIAKLSDPTMGVPGIPERKLAPFPPPSQPALRPLDRSTIQRLDALAESAIEAFLETERALWDCRGERLFDASLDSWFDRHRLVPVADRYLGNEYVPAAAILILLDVNDARADRLVQQFLDRATPHHEVGDDDVELVWRFRHRRPEVAAKWFAPQEFEEVPFAKVRATLGDPVAQRYVDCDHAVDFSDTDDLMNAPLPPGIVPNETQREQLHQRLLTWARENWIWSPPQWHPLRVARPLGFADVADALSQNPYLLRDLLTAEVRGERMDEPGLMLGYDLLLAWSALKPTRLLGQLIAEGFLGDLVGKADEASRASVRRTPRLAKNLEMSMNAYRSWYEQLKPALAVAWKRFRLAFPGDQPLL